MPSTFEEDLDISEFAEPHEYPVATATHKAVEVYERLVVRKDSLTVKFVINTSVTKAENPDQAPDLVIAGCPVVEPISTNHLTCWCLSYS